MDLDLLLRTSALLAVTAVVARLLRRATPSTRHLLWHVAIGLVVLTPLLMRVAPTYEITVPSEIEPTVASFAAPTTTTELPIASAMPVAPRPPRVDVGGLIISISVLLAVWFALGWMLSGLKVWRGSQVAPAEWIAEMRNVAARLHMPEVEVRQALTDGSPHVAGLFKSVVLLPPVACDWSVEDRRAALAHELTHIRRHDRRSQALAQIACCLYWFNPLVWYAAAALARERERACDDEVLKLGIKPSAYATLLLDLASTPERAWVPAAAMSMSRPSAIEGRLLSILGDRNRRQHRSSRWLVATGVVVLAAAILGARPAASATVAFTDQSRSPTPVPAPKPVPLVRPSPVMQLDDAKDVAGLTETLIEAMRDANGQVREQAALGLAFTPGPEVVLPLIEALKDVDPQVREKAAIGLAFRRDPRIVEPLLVAIEDADSQVREKAAIALGASGDTRALAALKKATTDPDSQVREKAVAGLTLLLLRR